jgi:hypothetical protein
MGRPGSRSILLWQPAEKCLLIGSLTSAAKAGAENKPVIAVLKHCATHDHTRIDFFPKPARANTGLAEWGYDEFRK